MTFGVTPKGGRRPNDWYPTPPALTYALLDVAPRYGVEIPRTLCEPCNGDGSISSILRARGYDVRTGDLDPFWNEVTDAGESLDFLGARALDFYAGRAMLSNIPFDKNVAPLLVKRALDLNPWAATILPLNWLEQCENRKAIAPASGLCIIFQRCAHTDFTGGGGDSKTVMWRIWDPSLGRLECAHVSREQLDEYAGQLSLFDEV